MPASRLAYKFEPLHEEELSFCWKSLVDQGQLSVPRLQAFMEEVCGEKLTYVAAKDLLGYMDANGDGRVGMEDFRNFMTIGTLADTNAKDFMWTPKRKYREEHGAGTGVGTGVGVGSAGPSPFSRESDRRESRRASACSVSSVASDVIREGRGPVSPDSKPAGHGFEPKAPERRRGLTRPSFGHLVPPVPEQREEEAEAPSSRQQARVPEPRQQAPPIDAKALAKIEAAIEKYERSSWQRLLLEEEDVRRRLFDQFAVAVPGELSAGEYHKMLQKWHRHARWSMPGDLRAGDSLAALQFILARQKKAAGGDAVGEEAAEAAPQETKLSFKLWLDVMKGHYAPEEHAAPAKPVH